MIGHYFKHDNISLNGELLDPESFGDDYFSTDSMTGHAIGLLDKHMKETPDKPFLLYMAFTAPHFPLQAKESDIAKYKGRFDKGWDELRDIKFKRMQELGVIDPSWELSPKEASSAYSWEDEPHKEWRLRAMEVYAALIDNMDVNIGRIISKLEETGQLDNTVIIFLSDNGGNAEFPNIKDPEIMPGSPDYMVGNGHYGHGWANLSNTPYRMYKHYIHEGGIASPFIVHWPNGLSGKGAIRSSAVQLPDIMATIVDITGAPYPQQYKGNDIMPMEGVSMLPLFQGSSLEKECLYWEHEGNCGVRKGKWKLVRFYDKPWELYDMELDGTETNDLSAQHPELVSELNDLYTAWTKRTNVLPYEEYMKYAVKKDKGQKRRQR